ncbi:MAG: prepilin peptidase [Acidimicrobiales bacterium]
MTAALLALAVAGLVVGSFLNVVIVRLPEGGSIVRPPSQCPECHAVIGLRDNVPVVSWLLLRGRCRSCATPIPVGYPLVEAGNAALWVLAGVRFGFQVALVPYLFLFSVLLAQSVIDLEQYRLLDRITYPAIAASAVALPVAALSIDDPIGAVLGAAIGSVAYFLLLFIPSLVHPQGMGLGDVKLAVLMGLYLGFIHPVLVLYAVIIACVLGIAVGIVLFFARAGPAGPFLRSVAGRGLRRRHLGQLAAPRSHDSVNGNRFPAAAGSPVDFAP